MIALIAKYRAKAGSENEVLALMSQMREATRREPGNVQYDLHQSESNPVDFAIYEQYRDLQAVEDHRASAHFQDLVLGRLVHLLEVRDVAQYRLL